MTRDCSPPRLAPSSTTSPPCSVSCCYERQRGAFDAPIVRHWGFDIHQLDPDVACALDAHIFCNREKFVYFTERASRGGCGLDGVPRVRGHRVYGQRPAEGRVHERRLRTAPVRLGWRDPHSVHRATVRHRLSRCSAPWHPRPHLQQQLRRPVQSDCAQGLDDRDWDEATRLCRFVHVHSSLQTIGANWAEVQRTKSRWVREFSRYDAGWSYIGDPFPWKPLENSAAIPNRFSTYVLAGIPIITDRRPGFYRYT